MCQLKPVPQMKPSHHFQPPSPARSAPSAARSAARENAQPSGRLRPFQKYWRLHDPLCRSFLQLGTHFQDFAAVKLAFPFVREATLLEAPQDSCSDLADSLNLALLAGHALGCHRPDLLEEVLPAYELMLAQRRVRLIYSHLKTDLLTVVGLDRAFNAIVAEQIEKRSSNARLSVFSELLLKSIRTGFYMAVIGVHDSVFSEFLSAFHEPVELPGILERRLVNSLWRDVEDGQRTPRHPLLRLGRELYPESNPLEAKGVLRFIHQQLRELNVRTEDTLPLADEDVFKWLSAGVNYGIRMQRQHPNAVRRILRECRGQRLEDCRYVVHEVVNKAGSLNAMALLAPLREWRKVKHPTAGAFSGQCLAELVYFADFVVWIGWLSAELKAGNRLSQ